MPLCPKRHVHLSRIKIDFLCQRAASFMASRAPLLQCLVLSFQLSSVNVCKLCPGSWGSNPSPRSLVYDPGALIWTLYLPLSAHHPHHPPHPARGGLHPDPAWGGRHKGSHGDGEKEDSVPPRWQLSGAIRARVGDVWCDQSRGRGCLVRSEQGWGVSGAIRVGVGDVWCDQSRGRGCLVRSEQW